jgi:anti-sigma factor RsiW
MPDLLNRILRRQPPGLSCRELVELVSDYLEGALPPAERARFEKHIVGCDNCAAYVRQMRETVALLGTLPADELSFEVEEELRAVFRDWRASQP